MDKIRQGPKSKIPRKSTAALAELKIKLANKCRTVVAYQVTALLIFVVLGFFIYSNTLNSPFVFDDRQNIQEDPYVRLTELTLRNIITAGLKDHASHRPIANISFALNYYFHRYDVIGYHYTNIIIHILTGIFLYLFIKNTLGMSLLRCRYDHYRAIAFFAALLWLVHPIQTQSVTYIVQRMNSMAAMFYILSLLLYVKGRLTIQEQKKSWPWFAGCTLAGLLALGCKETAATLPVFILLYEWYFFQDLKTPWLKRYLGYVIAAFVIFGILGLLYLGTSPLEKILSGYAHREFTLTERLLTQPRVVIYYISLLVYPHPGRLNLDHYFALSHSLIAPPTTLLCFGAIIGLIGLAFYIAKRERLLSFCILWFFGNLVIESSVIALELIFEHRLYLSSMLVSLAIVAMAWRFIKQNWVRVGVFCIVALLCCAWTYERNSVWSNPATLWKDCVAKSPEKARPHNNLGTTLKSQDKLDEAISHYRHALQLKPDYALAHYNLAKALDSQGNTEEAISHYRRALRIKPDFAEACYNLGRIMQTQGNPDEAINYYHHALRIKPDFAEAHNNLAAVLSMQGKLDEATIHYRQALQISPDSAVLHYNLANTLRAQGKLDEAISHYRQALRIKSDFAQAHNSLAGALARQGKLNEAITHFIEVVQLDPNSARAHYTLARALKNGGRIKEAITEFKETLRLRPNWVIPMNSLAWLLATHKDAKYRNPEEAIQLAERACKLTNYEKPALLNTLATAYAAADRFSEAVATAEKALELAKSSKQEELVEQIIDHLSLYKTGQPYIETFTKISPD